MDAGDWISLGSLVVTAYAVTYAAVAARHSRRSADASERSAAAGERSARAADRAATVAERAEKARGAPRFEYRAKGTSGTEATAIALLTAGPPEVDVRTVGVWIQDDQGGKVGTAFNPDPSRLGAIGIHPVAVDLRSWTKAVVVEVHLECTEVDVSHPRTWTRIGTVPFPAAPPGSATAPAEPPDRRPPGLFRDVSD